MLQFVLGNMSTGQILRVPRENLHTHNDGTCLWERGRTLWREQWGAENGQLELTVVVDERLSERRRILASSELLLYM